MKARTLILLIVVTGLAACSGLAPKLEKPDLQVVGVELQPSGLLQQQLRVRMRVTNPNDRALPVRSITYRVEVAGEQFATGESAHEFEVPALGSTEFDLSMKANAAGVLLRLLGGNQQPDALEYRLVGRVQLASGLLRNIPFEEKGRFSLR